MSALKANHKAALSMSYKTSQEAGIDLDFDAIAQEFFEQEYGQQ